MKLCEQLKAKLKEAMQLQLKPETSALRVIIGEFPRLNKKAGEDPTDEEVLQIIKKMHKSEKLVLEKKGEKRSVFLDVCELYLPKMMNEFQIKEFILLHYPDISEIPHKMKIMGQIMKHLTGKADGGLVKKVLTEL